MVAEVTRNDGALVNALTGLGTELDKTEAIDVGRASRLSANKKEELFLLPLMQNICCAYPSEGTRVGWAATLGGKKQDASVLAEFDNYRFAIGATDEDEDEEIISDSELIKTAQIFANIYNGAALVIVADDGQSPDKPLNKENIRTIAGIEILDSERILPDFSSSSNYLKPTHYLISVPSVAGDRASDLLQGKLFKDKNGQYNYRIHRSRIIPFLGRDGRRLPPNLSLRMGGWGQSTIDAVWNEFKLYESVYGSIAAMIDDASLFAYSLKGLGEKVKAGAEEAIKQRFRLLRMGAKNLGGVALDYDNEKVEWVTRQFAGIPELADRFRDRLVTVSGMPMTVIMGKGPLGLASQGTGDTEERVWASLVEAWQTTVLKPKLRRLFRLIWLAKDGPTKGKEPPDWGIKFHPLIVQSEEERMGVRAAAIQAYSTGIQSGFLIDEEVRNSMFGGDEFSIDITLNEKAWKKKQDEAAAQSDPFGGYGGYGGEQVPQEEAAPTEEAPQEQVVQDSVYLDAARRQGNKVWVEDNRVKNGGYWRKGTPQSKPESRPSSKGYREGKDSTFTHNGKEYELDKVLEEAEDKPVKQRKVSDLEWVLEHGEPNPERVKKADPDVPVIVTRYGDKYVVVDGFHRLAKAKAEGRKSIPTKTVTLKPSHEKGAKETRDDSAKRVVRWQGLDIGITHNEGDRRFPGAIPLSGASYGHLRRSWGKGEDGKAIDVYWGGDENAPDLYKVRQLDPLMGTVDETKYCAGFSCMEKARDAYVRHAGRSRFGGIEKVSPDELQVYRTDRKAEGRGQRAEGRNDGLKIISKPRKRRTVKQEKTDTEDSERADWDAGDYLIEEMALQGDRVLKQWLTQIKRWMKQQGSIENISKNLPQLYDHLEGGEFSQLMEQKMLLARLAGRLEVLEDASDG